MAPDYSKFSLSDHLSAPGLARWITALGIPDAPVRRDGVRITLRFLSLHMQTLPIAMALSFMRAMDLSKRVSTPRIQIGEVLAGTRTFKESPYKLFFTRVGRSLQNSGINPEGRHTHLFRAIAAFEALESFTSPAIDFWTPRAQSGGTTIAPMANTYGVMAAGGNTQLLIPNSASKVRVEHISAR